MRIAGLTHIMVLLAFVVLPGSGRSQICVKDSNYFSYNFHNSDNTEMTTAAVISQNEVVALLHHSSFKDYITKFTASGSVIWSNEYAPDYPRTYWWSYPWYENTIIQGMVTGKDSSCYVFGRTTEHGTTLNNAGPPEHMAGFIIHLDRFGNVISGKYLGQWFTDYSVNSVAQLDDGNLVVYLQSHFEPYISKLICINPQGDIIWGTPLELYREKVFSEITGATPIIKKLRNGNIVMVNEVLRNLDDTLIYPFLIIILKAPMVYVHMIQVDGKNGALLYENSYQCPMLTNTNAPASFVPRVKNITELPDGRLSFFADMYIPKDNLIFWDHYLFDKAPANIITDKHGDLLKFITYQTPAGPASLESAWAYDNDGQQSALAKDEKTGQLILFKVDADGQVLWSKGFTNTTPGPASSGVTVEKADRKGYFVFNSEPSSSTFHLTVTNAIGNNQCTQLPGIISAFETPWPWPSNKLQTIRQPLIIDFRYSPFQIAKTAHPITGEEICQAEQICCHDVIDSLHPHQVSICEYESYTLPDNTIVKETGTYYATYKTQLGCDSIEYYNVKVLKDPSHLQGSPDTCLDNAAVIQLHATPGYDTYLWNNIPSVNPFSEVHVPGAYTVKVENVCGSKTDTIMVFDHCEFPIYFPTAFTPNGDNLNDKLRVPPQNKNRLRKLTIYNRNGEVVFATSNPLVGWDGTFKGVAQPTGVFIYYLEMEGLSGKRLEQHGTVTLIR